MGNRSNILTISDSDPKTGIFMYSHWSGMSLLGRLQKALIFAKEEDRLDDASYLNRIIFCKVLAGDYEGSTGYGLSTSLQDNEHPIILVDVATKTISLVAEDRNYENGKNSPQDFWDRREKQITFDKFLELNLTNEDSEILIKRILAKSTLVKKPKAIKTDGK